MTDLPSLVVNMRGLIRRIILEVCLLVLIFYKSMWKVEEVELNSLTCDEYVKYVLHLSFFLLVNLKGQHCEAFKVFKVFFCRSCVSILNKHTRFLNNHCWLDHRRFFHRVYFWTYASPISESKQSIVEHRHRDRGGWNRRQKKQKKTNHR